MQKNKFFSLTLFLRALGLFLISLSVFTLSPAASVSWAAAWQANMIAVVSAANYEANCASESIAAAFGAQLSNSTLSADDADPATPGIQLPTTLGGTTVEVAGRAAGIFFVSPAQVNFLLPANLPLGNQAVVIRNNGVANNGTVTIAQNAPAIFTFNATGLGVIAGNALRVRNSVALYEDLAQSTTDGFITRAIDLGPATDQVFLVFYGTGWRQAGNATRVLLGGEVITPQFAGAQGSLVGLDQINALIPRSLLGRGRLSVVVAIPNTPPSNTGEAEIAGITTSNSPIVSSFTPDTTQAGQTVTINGTGFVANVSGNTVRIGNTEAQIISASASQIVARVPYGSDTSKILVRTVNGDGLSNNALRIRTSMSGVVESTNQEPLTNVIVRSLTDGLRLLTTTTALNGTFVLSEFTNPQNGAAFITIDGANVPTTPKFGTLTINQNYLSGRDTQFGNALTLQQVNGTSGQVGGGGLQAEHNGAPLTLTQPVYVPDLSAFASAPNTTIKAGDVTFELPADSAVRFSDGSTRGDITLTVVEKALLPVRFPAGLWSSAVVQITPFGTTFSKGGRFRFPNPERYPAGAKLFICQFDQGEKSATLGQWTAPGGAVVSSDGQFIETDADSIKQGAYYFLVGARQLTSVTGRVLESDRSPTRRARVRIRGQEALTDGNGGFLIRNVPVGGPNDILIVEATVVRTDGRIDYANSNRTAANPNSVTNVGIISLPDPSLNQPPVLLIASTLTTPATKQVDYEFYAYDYDDRRIPRLVVTGPSFAQVIPGTIDAKGQATPSLLRLAPSANQLGTFSLIVTATDSFGATVSRTVNVTVIR